MLWLAMAAAVLIDAGISARAGLVSLEQARSASPSSLLSPHSTARLRDAQADLASARARLRLLGVSPLRALPVVGRQLRAADHLAAAAGEVAGTVADALEQARGHLEGGLPSGSGRARLLADISEVAREAEDKLRAVELGPADALVGPVAHGRARAADQLQELREGVSRARVASAGLADLLAGTSTQLLLFANNAEMRAGSGMFLTVGTLTIDDGSLRLGEIVPTFDFQLPESVPIHGDLADLWGWLEPGREWRNLATTPRFDVTAPLAARMWAAARGQEVDGVLAVDVFGLQSLLAAVGAIEVDGQRLDAESVVEDLLHDQYVGLDEEDLTSQAERRGRLGMVARSALQALEERYVDVDRLAEELAAAAQARHVLAWSATAAVQEAWEALGVDGALHRDDLLVSVLNRGGNKLDPYLGVEAELRLEKGPTMTAASIELRLSNEAVGDEPPYILGPAPPLTVAPGSYVGLVSVALPGAASGGRFDGVEALSVAGPDGPTRAVAAPVEIPLGEARVLTVRFELPIGVDRMELLPSARSPAITWRWEGRSWQDDHVEVVRW